MFDRKSHWDPIRFTRLLVVPLLVLLALAACQQQPQPLEITIIDGGYEVSGEPTAGWVRVNVTNNSSEPDHAQLLRLNDGITLDELAEAAEAEGPDAVLSLVTTAGGVGIINPDQSGTSTVNLSEGSYLVQSLAVPGSQPAPFAVGSGRGTTPPPPDDVSVTLGDFHIDMPADLEAGDLVLEVANQGPQQHEVLFFKLTEGTTGDEALAYLMDESPEGPPPFEFHGGMQAMEVGDTAYAHMTFEEGDYLAVCFVPDTASGAPHIAMNMSHTFTVR